MTEPQSKIVDLHGHPYHYLDFSGEGKPPLVFVHGTGLHSWTWLTHARELSDRYHCYSFDHRAHGDSTQDRESLDWGKMADDLAAFINALGLDKPYGVGHSMGGATLLMAEGRHPGTLGRLVLADPILMPEAYYEIEATVENQPMAARTIKRRGVWDSRDQMIETYQQKLPFKTWKPQELKHYVEHGTREVDGGQVALKCPPQTEARCYLGGHATSPWPLLDNVKVESLLLLGDKSDTKGIVQTERVADSLDRGHYESMPGASHFIPMDVPEALTRKIIEFDSTH